MNITQAVLLAAGGSSRLWPLTTNRHKCELPLLGKTLLNRTLRVLVEKGITNIVIVHHENHLIGVDEIDGVNVTFIPLDKPDGMGYALLRAASELQEHFLLIHPYHVDAVTFLPKLLTAAEGKDAAILVAPPEKGKKGGLATVTGDRVSSVEETVYTGQPDTHYIQGMYILSSAYVETLKKEEPHHYSFESALHTFASGHAVGYHHIAMPLVSLKYPWHLFDMRDYLMQHMTPSTSKQATIPPTSVIEGDVVIEDGASIGAYAVVRGPAYIGKHVFVGDHTLVRDGSVLEEGALVGAHAEVKNSIVMEGSYAQGYVADSIIGKQVKVAHGFTTGNRRIDRGRISVTVGETKVDTGLTAFGVVIGDGASFGITVSTMPGACVGSGAIVGPGTIVFGNVPEKTRHYVVQEIRHE